MAEQNAGVVVVPQPGFMIPGVPHIRQRVSEARAKELVASGAFALEAPKQKEPPAAPKTEE